MPWIQFQVTDEEYAAVEEYARAKNREAGNLAWHALAQMMGRYPLRASEIAWVAKVYGKGEKD